MKNDKLLILFILLIAGAIYLNVTHYHLPSGWPLSRAYVAPAATGHAAAGSLDSYPDVMVRLVFDSIPPDAVLHDINAYKGRYAVRYKAWISELALDSASGHYLLASDFQSTTYSQQMIQELTDSIYALTGSRLRYIQYE